MPWCGDHVSANQVMRRFAPSSPGETHAIASHALKLKPPLLMSRLCQALPPMPRAPYVPARSMLSADLNHRCWLRLRGSARFAPTFFRRSLKLSSALPVVAGARAAQSQGEQCFSEFVTPHASHASVLYIAEPSAVASTGTKDPASQGTKSHSCLGRIFDLKPSLLASLPQILSFFQPQGHYVAWPRASAAQSTRSQVSSALPEFATTYASRAQKLNPPLWPPDSARHCLAGAKSYVPVECFLG